MPGHTDNAHFPNPAVCQRQFLHSDRISSGISSGIFPGMRRLSPIKAQLIGIEVAANLFLRFPYKLRLILNAFLRLQAPARSKDLSVFVFPAKEIR